MLKELYIKNLAVIEEARLDFQNGFHIFTGETGAGKSILVEATRLVLGERVSAQLVRDGSDEAFVESVFDVTDCPEVKAFLKEQDLVNLDDEDELILKRVISSAGKTKVLVNSQRSTLKTLQKISHELIDFTGQHQQLELLDSNNDIVILDRFLDSQNPLQVYQSQYQEVRALHQKIQDLEKKNLEKEERLEWVQHQLREIQNLKIVSVEEEQEWRRAKQSLKNQNLFREFSSFSDQNLNQSLEALKSLEHKIHSKEEFLSLYKSLLPQLEQAKSLLEDLSFESAKTLQDQMSFSSEFHNTEEIDEQLFLIEKLKRKFGPELQDVLQKKEELEEQLSELKGLDDKLARLQDQYNKDLKELSQKAQKLTDLRKKAAKKIEKEIKKELEDLQMPLAEFFVNISKPEEALFFRTFHAFGWDQVQFLLSPNPGLAPQPLAKIASGGETSRLFLAIKNVLTKHRKAGTLIFDEVDTGISGATVELTGKKLKSLANRLQVLCITHHAQIASLADRHFLVKKEVQKNQTFTRVQTLKDDERLEEVARLMGGVKISNKTLEHAKELLAK